MSNLATIVNNILADSGIDDINVVVTNGSYSNPAWITALSWSKITSTPTTLSGYGITDAVPANRTITINGTAQDLSVNRSWSVGTVTSVDMTVPTGFSISGSPITSSGTLALTFSAGYSLPTTAVQSNWTTAYNDSIVSASVSGTTTKTLTLNQQDGGTITASWTDYDTAPVTSVNAGTGISVNQTTGAVTVTNTGVLVNDITSSSGQGRFGGWYQGNGYTGPALEVGYSGGAGNVIAYDRSGGGYQPLYITGSNLYLRQSGGLVWTNSQLVRESAGVGWLSGNYASSETASTTGAIYSIGGSYYPTSTTLNTMYGVGYTHSAQGSMPSGASGWGFYVNANGTVRVWLGADNGNIIAIGDIYANTSSIVATRTWVNSQGFITGGPYLPLSGGTIAGDLIINAGGSYPLRLSSTQRYMMQVRNTNNTVNSGYGWWWFMDTNFNMGFHADGAADRMTLTRAGDLYLTSNMYVNGNGSSTGTQVVYNSGTWGISITGNADTVDGYHATNAASGLAYYASNGYLYVPSWINVDNGGIFSSTNSAHFRPNPGTFGSWLITGSRNNYRGFEFDSGVNGNIALMFNNNSNVSGFYNVSYGWQILWENGTFYVYKNAYGGGTQATVLDSSNYNSYAPTLTGTGASGTWGINITGSSGTAGSTQTLALTSLGNGSVNVNNPNTAVYRTENGSGAALSYSPVLHVGGGDTMWQVQGTYGTSGDGTLYFRQGYNGSWGNWLTMLSSANYNSYSPTLTGGGASGTWGINITGTASSETLATVTARGNTTTTSMAVGYGSIPNGRLYVNSSSSLDALAIQSTTNGVALVFADNVTPTWANAPRVVGYNNDLYIRTLATDRIRVTSGGDTYLYGDLYLGSTNTRINATAATGYVRIYGSAGNYLAIGPYNNNGWAYQENIGNANGTYYYVQNGRHAFDGGAVTPYSDGTTNLGTGGYRWANVYTSGWFRNYGATGIYNESYDTHFYSPGTQYFHLSTSTAGYGALILYNGYNSTAGGSSGRKGYVYWDSNGFGFLGGGDAEWAVNVNPSTGKYVTIGGSQAWNAYNSSTGVRLMFGGGNSDAQGNYYIGTNLENYGGNYNKLDIAWHTGIRLGAQATYGGVRIFDSEDFGTKLFSVGETDTNVRVTNTLYSYAYRGNGNVAGTGEATYHPAGIYSTGTNWLYGTMYLNVNPIYDTGDIRTYNSSYFFRARYTAGSDIYHGSLNWYGLQLGNNGDNYIIAGRTATGGQFRFYVNNTTDFTSINGTLAAMMFSTGRTAFGGSTDSGYMLTAYGDIYASGGWLRVSGNQGLYFESYDGGWRMTDSSYIRSYNGKALSMEGASVDYVSSIYMNGGVYIQTFNNRNLIVKSTGSSDAGILGRGSGDQFAFQVYGSGGDYGFLNSAWGAWDIRKTANGSLYMNDNTSYYLNTTSSSVSANINGAILSNSSFGTNGYGASSNAAAGRVYGPKGAAYSYSGGTIYGAIKIRLPFRNSDGMWSMKVRIYNYSQQQTSEYLLGNYSYDQGAYNFSATYLGGSSSNAFTVRFGNEGGYDCVWIGETGTGWSYPVVSVIDFMMGYSNGNVSNYYQNWDISIVGSLGTVGATVAPNIKFGNAFASYYYDSADSTYYVRPSSLSYMHTVSSFYVQNNYGVSSDHAYGIYFDSGRSTAYAIFRESGAWDFPYPDLRIAFHTGIKIGANASYKGVRFYTDYDMSGLVLSVNNADYNTGGIYVHGTAYASAYYETSDARVKKILEDNSRVNGIESIKPKLYEKDGKTEFGYIAQDFLEIMPYAINNDNKDGYYSLVYREVHTAKIAYLEDSIEEIKAKILYLENQLKTKQ